MIDPLMAAALAGVALIIGLGIGYAVGRGFRTFSVSILGYNCTTGMLEIDVQTPAVGTICAHGISRCNDPAPPPPSTFPDAFAEHDLGTTGTFEMGPIPIEGIPKNHVRIWTWLRIRGGSFDKDCSPCSSNSSTWPQQPLVKKTSSGLP